VSWGEEARFLASLRKDSQKGKGNGNEKCGASLRSRMTAQKQAMAPANADSLRE
jgi:hypothetical protein